MGGKRSLETMTPAKRKARASKASQPATAARRARAKARRAGVPQDDACWSAVDRAADEADDGLGARRAATTARARSSPSGCIGGDEMEAYGLPVDESRRSMGAREWRRLKSNMRISDPAMASVD